MTKKDKTKNEVIEKDEKVQDNQAQNETKDETSDKVTEKNKTNDEVTEKNETNDEVLEKDKTKNEVTEKDEKVQDNQAQNETKDETSDKVTEKNKTNDEVTEKNETNDEVVEKDETNDEVTEKNEKVQDNQAQNETKNEKIEIYDDIFNENKNKKNKMMMFVTGGILGVLTCGIVNYCMSYHDDTIATFKDGNLKIDNVIKYDNNFKPTAKKELTIKVIQKAYPKQSKKVLEKIDKSMNQKMKEFGGEKQFSALLAQQNISLETFKENLIYNSLLSLAIYENNTPTKSDLEKIYNKQDNTVYDIKGIVVGSQNRADDIKNQLENGKTFKNIKLDKDKESYINNDKEEMKKTSLKKLTQLDENFANSVSKSKVGDVNIVKGLNGLFIVYKIEKKADIPFKDEHDELVLSYVKNEVNKNPELISNVLNKLYNKMNVKIVNKQFDSIKQN